MVSCRRNARNGAPSCLHSRHTDSPSCIYTFAYRTNVLSPPSTIMCMSLPTRHSVSNWPNGSPEYATVMVIADTDILRITVPFKLQCLIVCESPNADFRLCTQSPHFPSQPWPRRAVRLQSCNTKRVISMIPMSLNLSPHLLYPCSSPIVPSYFASSPGV